MENGLLKFSYFEKPMKTQLVLMRRSAMGENQRMDILSNELVRRISNIGENIPLGEVIDTIDNFTRQLKNSEYERKQIKNIIVSGMRGFQNKQERRKRAGEKFYRLAEDTLVTRTKKKLTEKTNWFRKRKKKEIGNLKIGKKKGQNRAGEKRSHGGEDEGRAKAVIYVPHTHGSRLAKAMREKENELEKLTGYRVKIVEKAGDPLERIIVKSNPWSGQDCERGGCFLCQTKQKTEKQSTQSCSKRSAVYETWCETCKKEEEKKIEKLEEETGEKLDEMKRAVRLYKYVGETNRSTYERGYEHLMDMRQISKGSHILKHLVDKHEGENIDKIDFRMKVIKFHKSSFERQIHESVLIQSNRRHCLLNSKSEFNRCAIPRLGMKLGEKEYIENREETIAEEKREAELEEKLRIMRKDYLRRKEPRRPQREQPARKKARLEETEDISVIEGMAQMEEELAEKAIGKRKRKLEKQTDKKKQSDIRDFIQEKPQKRQRLEDL